jgi:hypothetical protein
MKKIALMICVFMIRIVDGHATGLYRCFRWDEYFRPKMVEEIYKTCDQHIRLDGEHWANDEIIADRPRDVSVRGLTEAIMLAFEICGGYRLPTEPRMHAICPEGRNFYRLTAVLVPVVHRVCYEDVRGIGAAPGLGWYEYEKDNPEEARAAQSDVDKYWKGFAVERLLQKYDWTSPEEAIFAGKPIWTCKDVPEEGGGATAASVKS